MPCPTCGGDTRVIDSRGRNGYVYRRRECLDYWEHRFSTIETLVIRPVGARRKRTV